MDTPLGTAGFASLAVRDWRQFADVNISFHPRLTVLTGANASGKTTLLNLLGRHFNWQSQLLGVPINVGGWLTDIRGTNAGPRSIGNLVYGSGTVTDLLIQPNASGAEYSVGIPGQQSIPGVFMPSHRALARYTALEVIPARFSAANILFDQFSNEVLLRYLNVHSGKSTLTTMKESLIAAAIYGEGSTSVQSNAEALSVWQDYQVALRHVLPPSFQFRRLLVRSPEVIVQTETTEFLLDAVSGGILAIMELCWQIFLHSRQRAAFTVCMDEPENHLHPSLQRSLIPGLLAAFPEISFIVASHSPFIVTAVQNSHVYVFHDEDGTGVRSRLLDRGNKAGTADETLRRVLGLGSTVPMWVETKINGILEDLQASGASAGNIRALQLALREIGMQDQFPAAVDALTSLDNNA